MCLSSTIPDYSAEGLSQAAHFYTSLTGKYRLDVDVRKYHALYLDGQFGFQRIFVDSLLFDGRIAPKMSTKSLSVIEALSKLTRPQGELSPFERHAVERGLFPGTLKSLSLGLLTWDSLDNCNGLPYLKLRIRPSVLQLCQTSQAWNNYEEDAVLKSLDDLVRSTFHVESLSLRQEWCIYEATCLPSVSWMDLVTQQKF